MREIKFRGKRIDTGEWVFGYFSMNDENGKCYITNQTKAGGAHPWEVDPETVGEFTGRRDKSGLKDVFESDRILASESVRHGRIEGIVFWKQTGWYIKDITTEDDVYLDCCSDIEIIGTIHDQKAEVEHE
jgi:hypothetical protein